MAWALTLPCIDGLAAGVLEVEGVDTPALTVPAAPLPLTLKLGDTDPIEEVVMVGEGEEENVPFKLREGRVPRKGCLPTLVTLCCSHSGYGTGSLC